MSTVEPRRAARWISLAVIAWVALGCSENPLDPDDEIDPEAYLFGDSSPATCDDVCEKLAFCFSYDRATCAQECPELTAEQRQAIVDATCEVLAAELSGG